MSVNVKLVYSQHKYLSFMELPSSRRPQLSKNVQTIQKSCYKPTYNNQWSMASPSLQRGSLATEHWGHKWHYAITVSVLCFEL